MTWNTVANVAEFDNATIKSVILEGKPIMISKIGDEFHAIDAVCTHKYAYLPMGKLNGGCIVCPAHGAEFDLASGKITKGLDPARIVNFPMKDLNSYEVKVENGDVKVNI